MAHTPGPWTIDDRRITATSDRYGQKTKVVLIAKMERHRLGSADRVCPDDIQQANARLIATAPELLEVAQGCLGWLEYANAQSPPFGPDEAWMKPLRDAIAKATPDG